MINHSSKCIHIRAVVIALMLALSIFCLAAGAVFDGFYMEYGALKAGTYETPIVYVKATKTRERYDALDVKEGSAGNLNFSVKVRGQCAEGDRLHGLAYVEVRGNGKNQQVSYPINSANRSIGPDHGQGWDVFAFKIPFIPPQGQSPVSLCNAELDKASDETARKRMLQEGFNFTLEKAYTAGLSVECEHKVLGLGDLRRFGASAALPLKVRCLPVVTTKGPPPREGKPLDFDPPIKSLDVAADPATTEGRKCPVYVNFRGRITAGEKSQYSTFNTKYRFVGDNNYTTDWLPVSIERGMPRTVNSRRFIQSSDTPRGMKAPGGKENVPIFHGWMLLEVMLPDGTIRSERTPFSVDCNPKSPPVRMKNGP